MRGRGPAHQDRLPDHARRLPQGAGGRRPPHEVGPLPVPSREAELRVHGEDPHPRRHQTQRPVGLGLQHAPVRGARAAAAGRAAGVHRGPHERSARGGLPRGAVPRCCAASHNDALEPYFLEVFSGSCHLSKAVAVVGLPAQGWDIENGIDLLCPGVQEALRARLLAGDVAAIHAGLPCTSWSRARKWDNLGPPPLRSDTELYGRVGLSAVDQHRVHVGNALLQITHQFLSWAAQLGIPWLLENPASSRAWLTDEVQDLMKKGGVCIQCDYCQYGMPWRKATTFMCGNFQPPQLRCCNPVRGRCSASGTHHIILQGRDAQGMFWTLRAQPYPPSLCRTLADAVASASLSRKCGQSTSASGGG